MDTLRYSFNAIKALCGPGVAVLLINAFGLEIALLQSVITDDF